MKKPNNNLQELRNQIDAVDKEIVSLIGTRQRIAVEIANHKKSQTHVVDRTSEKQVLEQADQAALLNGIDRKFVKRLFRLIIRESRRIQEEIINEK